MRQRPRLHLRWIFIDSSAYYASAVRRDANYRGAQAVLRSLAQERARFFTTPYVLARTHPLVVIPQRDGQVARALLDAIERTPGTTVIDRSA